MKIRLLTFVLILSLIGLVGVLGTSYASISPTKIELKAEDSDKDGYSNLCEYLHKTDPNDAESKPSVNITINVPSDVKTIQEAINASIDGDTIAVSQGRYQGNINFNDKSITLTSIDPDNPDVVADTIIEGTESGSVITIDSVSVLKGFTITSGEIDCRGIYVKDASPTIENCTIIDNQTTESGGGIYNTTSSSPQIINCIITGNKDSSGIHESAQIAGGTPEISQSWINGTGLVDSSEPTSTPAGPATTESPTIAPQPEDSSDATIDTDDGSPVILLSGSPVWYVDDDAPYWYQWHINDAPVGGDGRTWETAFKYLQDALAVASAGEEIWVAKGHYRPDEATGIYRGDCTATFQLINDVAIYGGFPSGGGVWEDRNWVNNQTILSGFTYIYHVVTGSNTDATAILDGFTITGGKETRGGSGGGMYNYNGSPTLTNCIFSRNYATSGGGMSNMSGSNPTLTNCIFTENMASGSGGGMYNYRSSPKLTNCVFSNNSALRWYGGAIANFSGCNLTLTNCTFYGNSAHGRGFGKGGAIANNTRCNGTITNCIFWDNEANVADEIYNSGSSYPIVTYCDIEGDSLYPGVGNINSDPLFVNASNPAGADGKFFTLDDGLRIRINSPCIDAANGDTAPLTDIIGLERIDIANMPNTGTGTSDYADIGACESGHDSDSDGMPDEWEVFYRLMGLTIILNPSNPDDADDDPDGDGLTNLQEYLNGTDPTKPDNIMPFVVESESYGGVIYALTEDTDYVYAGGETGTVRKYNKSNMTPAGESPGYGGTIYALTSDDDYVYAGGETTNTVRKYNKSDMTLVEPNGESPSYGGTIYALTSDDDYVYAGGWSDAEPEEDCDNDVRRYRKSNMSFVDKTSTYDDCHVTSLSSDANYIYVGRGYCGSWREPQKYSKNANMPWVATGTPPSTSSVFCHISDADYVYAGTDSLNSDGIVKYRKSDMYVVDLIDDYRDFHALTLDDTYIYGGLTALRKYFKSDLSFVAVASPSYGGIIYALTSDANYVYAGGNNGPYYTVRKYAKVK